MAAGGRRRLLYTLKEEEREAKRAKRESENVEKERLGKNGKRLTSETCGSSWTPPLSGSACLALSNIEAIKQMV